MIGRGLTGAPTGRGEGQRNSIVARTRRSGLLPTHGLRIHDAQRSVLIDLRVTLTRGVEVRSEVERLSPGSYLLILSGSHVSLLCGSKVVVRRRMVDLWRAWFAQRFGHHLVEVFGVARVREVCSDRGDQFGVV